MIAYTREQNSNYFLLRNSLDAHAFNEDLKIPNNRCTMIKLPFSYILMEFEVSVVHLGGYVSQKFGFTDLNFSIRL